MDKVKLNSVKRSIRFILLILFVIVIAYAYFFDDLLEAINHNKIINTAIISMQVIGVIYTFIVSVSLMSGINSWKKFLSVASENPHNFDKLNNFPFKGAVKGLRGRVSDLALSGPEIRNSVLDKLKDGFSHRVSGADYLSGLLVGLGLLGTFIGLILTMGSIRESMDIVTNNTSDISALLGGIAAPLGGMSAAFTASFLGLMGSLVMGLLAHLLGSIVDNIYFSVEDWAKTNANDVPVSISSEINGTAESALGSSSGGKLQTTNLSAALLDSFNQFLTFQKKFEDNQIQQIESTNKLANYFEKLIQQQEQSFATQNQTFNSMQSVLGQIQSELEGVNSMLASLDGQQPILRSIQVELETANNTLNAIDDHTVKINDVQRQAIEVIENVYTSTDRNRTALVEAIGGMNADRLQIVTSFKEVTETLTCLQSEMEGVRQQLLTIESVARMKTSDSEAVVQVMRQQNEFLNECVNQMTSLKASVQN